MPLIRQAALACGAVALGATTAAAETVGGLAYADAVSHADRLKSVDSTTLAADADLVEMSPRGGDGAIQALVEIPTGTSAKWEVSGEDPSRLIWEMLEDGPRVVDYLAYPGNYGLIPGTALPEDLGGDGDPLDVIVLGQAAPRGTVLDARLIGVLKMTDAGARDDKLLAVMADDSPFAEVETLEQLDKNYPGVSQIVATWFENYKGPDGGMVNEGFAGVDEARSILEQAIANYDPTN